MPAERYFLEQEFNLKETKVIAGAEHHHLAHVMRAKKGDEVELVNGMGSLALAVVEEIKKDRAILSILLVEHKPLPPCRLVLAQAIPKLNRLDFIIEKGTELGVDAFWLFPGCRSNQKELHPSQLERAKSVAIAAMKQCGRLDLPKLVILPPLLDERWRSLMKGTAFFGDINPATPLFEVIWQQIDKNNLPTIFFTGPEGGFSLEEEQTLRKLEVLGVKLHHNILRTETASLMAISLMTHWLET